MTHYRLYRTIREHMSFLLVGDEARLFGNAEPTSTRRKIMSYYAVIRWVDARNIFHAEGCECE